MRVMLNLKKEYLNLNSNIEIHKSYRKIITGIN